MRMYKGLYKIADEVIEICSIYEQVQQMCHDYAIGSAESEGADVIRVSTQMDEIRAEQKMSDEEMRYEGLEPIAYPESYLETLVVYRKMCTELPKRGVMLMHGSVLAVDGEGFLFTAASGTGKSTHVRLWRKAFGNRAVMVNDDKPLVRVINAEGSSGSKGSSGSEGTKVIVYGTPWDGKHHLSNNISVPLKAICILERGKENEIKRVDPVWAFPMLIQQTFRPDESVSFVTVMEMLSKLAERVGLYNLHCNMEDEAAIVSARGMGVKI